MADVTGCTSVKCDDHLPFGFPSRDLSHVRPTLAMQIRDKGALRGDAGVRICSGRCPTFSTPPPHNLLRTPDPLLLFILAPLGRFNPPLRGNSTPPLRYD
eukprot:1188186-Prorocentrum_minimum.AAC.3